MQPSSGSQNITTRASVQRFDEDVSLPKITYVRSCRLTSHLVIGPVRRALAEHGGSMVQLRARRRRRIAPNTATATSNTSPRPARPRPGTTRPQPLKSFPVPGTAGARPALSPTPPFPLPALDPHHRGRSRRDPWSRRSRRCDAKDPGSAACRECRLPTTRSTSSRRSCRG